MTDSTAKEIALKWIELYNDGTPEAYGSHRFLELYAEDVDWYEMPTRFNPQGRRGNLATLRETGADGRVVNRQATLRDLVAEDGRAALRHTWEATVVVDGLGVAKGTRVRAEIAQFIEVRDGKIVQSIEVVAALPPA